MVASGFVFPQYEKAADFITGTRLHTSTSGTSTTHVPVLSLSSPAAEYTDYSPTIQFSYTQSSTYSGNNLYKPPTRP